MVVNARLDHSDDGPTAQGAPEVHPVSWGVTRASALARGDRRLEAETYLSDGFGLRVALESRDEGWTWLGSIAHVWQPNRLKGAVVEAANGVPFFAAGQVFELRPAVRKWLSLSKTPDAEERFVERGTLLLSRSGNVGRIAFAHAPHLKCLITDDLLRIEPVATQMSGWLYAYMRTEAFRAIARGARYGHTVKHLEVAHADALPVVKLDEDSYESFNRSVSKIFAWRDAAYQLFLTAEDTYSRGLGWTDEQQDRAVSTIQRASSLISGRRRLDAFYYNSTVENILKVARRNANKIDSLEDVCDRIWWPHRFSRVFSDNGTPYFSAEELFNLNPPVVKRVYAGLIKDREGYFLEPGWLYMARSGQIYGLNGSVGIASERHARFIISDDLIRIAPDAGQIRPGYLMAVLGHPALGRPLVIRHAYGTSIPHLEPFDIGNVAIPRLNEEIEEEIADMIDEAVRLRAQADDLEDEITNDATRLVERFLHGESLLLETGTSSQRSDSAIRAETLDTGEQT